MNTYCRHSCQISCGNQTDSSTFWSLRKAFTSELTLTQKMFLQENWKMLHQNFEHLWVVLDFKNLVELQKFLESKLFKLFFEIYQQDYLIFERNRFAKQDRFMTRDKNIRIIQTRILDEKRFKLMKFSNKTSNKKDWNDVDHMTSFMHDVRHQNTMKFDDLFFESIFDDVEKNRRIWSLIQYVIKNTTASRTNKSVNKKNKKKNQNSQFKIVDVSKKSYDFLSNFERSLISFFVETVSAFKFTFKLFKFNVKNFKAKVKISKKEKKIKVDDRHQILERHDVTIVFENESILNLKIFFDLADENIADFSVKNEKTSNIENVKFINAKKMIRKFYFVIFNIKNRWWKI